MATTPGGGRHGLDATDLVILASVRAGLTADEIAEGVNVSRATVYRRIRRVKERVDGRPDASGRRAS